MTKLNWKNYLSWFVSMELSFLGQGWEYDGRGNIFVDVVMAETSSFYAFWYKVIAQGY